MAIEISARELEEFIKNNPKDPPFRGYYHWIGEDLDRWIGGDYSTTIHFPKKPDETGYIRRWKFVRPDKTQARTYIILGEQRIEEISDSKFFLRSVRLRRSFDESNGILVNKLYRDTFNKRFEVPPPQLRERVVDTFSVHQPWLRSHLEFLTRKKAAKS